MSFLVEDGTGLASANSYASVAEARAYWIDRGVTFTQGDPALQVALVLSTDYIELRFAGRFKGCIQFPPTQSPVFLGQRLSFPRLYVYDRNGYCITGVPQKVKDTTAEYMSRVLANGSLMPDPTNDPTVTMEKIGPIMTSFLPGATQIVKPYPTADRLLSEFMFTGGYAMR